MKQNVVQMEDEKRQIQVKTSRLTIGLEHYVDKVPRLEAAANLREQRDRNVDLISKYYTIN